MARITDYLPNAKIDKPSVEEFNRGMRHLRESGKYNPSEDRIGKKTKKCYSILLFKPVYNKNFTGYYIGVTVNAASLKKAKEKALSNNPGYFFKEAELVNIGCFGQNRCVKCYC